MKANSEDLVKVLTPLLEKVIEELNELPEEDAKTYLRELGLEEDKINKCFSE